MFSTMQELPVNEQKRELGSPIPLTQLSRGQKGRVRIADTTGEVRLLRAMGLRPNSEVTMCRLGEPCIISLNGSCGDGCRLGLAKEIAGRVMVQVDQELDQIAPE